VRADRTRIEQVVTNLVANAVQHTAPGGRIVLRVAARDGEAILTVTDDGAGMDAETAGKAFELFFQGTTGKGGLGVGLTLARRIVEMHGGTISIASAGPGKGATFTLRFPAIEAAADEGGAVEPSRARSRSVVLVEDAADARISLQKILEHEGHRVRAAADGASGLAAILEEKPDIAIIDIGLPEMDGHEVARRARASGIDAYLIALTGYGRAEDKAAASEAGFDLHMTKPPPMERLLALIAEAPKGARLAA
jgi:CheY-like chemotaxis protein/anti-sigma regulatory factor (Ser/Thr protein kinase)